MERNHLVLVYMCSSEDFEARTTAIYQGECEERTVKVAYWNSGVLVVPLWFETERTAREFADSVGESVLHTYHMVQERHYAKSDSRLVCAKIIGHMENDFYPGPSKGQTRERYGEPLVEVWTMYFKSRDLADQYVKAVNDDAETARDGGI